MSNIEVAKSVRWRGAKRSERYVNDVSQVDGSLLSENTGHGYISSVRKCLKCGQEYMYPGENSEWTGAHTRPRCGIWLVE
jgi:hypothetical protein